MLSLELELDGLKESTAIREVDHEEIQIIMPKKLFGTTDTVILLIAVSAQTIRIIGEIIKEQIQAKRSIKIQLDSGEIIQGISEKSLPDILDRILNNRNEE